jgi:hypothetical protein
MWKYFSLTDFLKENKRLFNILLMFARTFLYVQQTIINI